MPSPAGAGCRRHDGDRVPGAVRHRQGEARAVGREVGVGERREVRRVRQQVDELAGRAVPAVDVVALRPAVVAGEVEGVAVRRELRAAAAVVQVADAARRAVREVADEDLPVAALVPLERDGVARRRERVRPEVLSDLRRGRQLFDERRSHGSPSDRSCPCGWRGSVRSAPRAPSLARAALRARAPRAGRGRCGRVAAAPGRNVTGRHRPTSPLRRVRARDGRAAAVLDSDAPRSPAHRALRRRRSGPAMQAARRAGG